MQRVLCSLTVQNVCDHTDCVQVCVEVYERYERRRRKRVGTPGALMPPGLILMDTLAQQTRRNKGRKVFFFSHRQRREEGAGLCTRCTVPVLFISLFFPSACDPAGVDVAQKGWHLVKAEKPGLRSGCVILVMQTRSVFLVFQHVLSNCAEVCMSC